MSPTRLRLATFLFLALLASVPRVVAQDQGQACAAPPVLQTSDPQNLFNDETETEMGNIIAEGFDHDLPIVRGPLNDYLQQVGARLLKQMPPSKIGFHFVLVDMPYINAFGFPGGHIYVSRKLALAANSEDDLAGVLAHEIGHIITHQSAIEMSGILRQIGITSLKNKQDVLDAYNKMLDSKAKVKRSGDSEEKHQQVADQIAVYGSVRAGYRAQAYADFWNRATEIHGKTGSWFSDFFGTTKPESKRLRLILQYAATLPASCVADNSPHGDFVAWRTSVLENDRTARVESVPGLIQKQVLDPPLRPPVTTLAFSPDGKYLLAQDDGNIFVLTREPFTFLFRVSAHDAHPAFFTQDSKSILFYTSKLRIEQWSVTTKKREKVNEVNRMKPCLQTELSSSGAYLACYDEENTVNLIDVATGETFFTQKEFYTPNSLGEYFRFLLLIVTSSSQEVSDVHFIEMKFSPDERYFLAGRHDTNVAYDLKYKAKASLPGSIRNLIGGSFSFLGNDRLAGVGIFPGDAKIVRFPSGETLQKITITGSVTGVSKGEYLLLRPIRDFATGIFDIAQNKLVGAGKNSAMDLYDKTFVNERANGELGLFDANTGNRMAVVTLPRSNFGRLWSLSASPDFKYLAVSERSRGAVWDLQKNSSVFHIQGFRNSYLDRSGQMYFDFTALGERKRTMARIDPVSNSSFNLQEIDHERMIMLGKELITYKPNGKKEDTYNNVTIEVSDLETKKVLWSRNYAKAAPGLMTNPEAGLIAFTSPLSDKSVEDAARSDASLSKQIAANKDYKSNFLVEVVDGATGASKGKVLVDPGKRLRLERIRIGGDWLAMSDGNHRIMIYDLAKGELKGKIFGENIFLPASGPIAGLETEDGKFDLYDLNTLQVKAEAQLPERLTDVWLSNDNKKAVIITEDQTAYIVDLEKMAASGQIAENSSPK